MLKMLSICVVNYEFENSEHLCSNTRVNKNKKYGGWMDGCVEWRMGWMVEPF